MHIYFSGIGGTGIGPLALIAKQAGYVVSGSDIHNSQYIDYLKAHGINDIHIGQTKEAISRVHKAKPVDWFVYSSALPRTNPNHPELLFAKQCNIRSSKRDDLLNEILSQKKLKLIAISGTHGKTTTTAMTIWAFKELGIKLSYSVGAKINFGEMGHFEPDSQYFVYEADEFDRNFLSFHPYLSIIVGIAYDHHEIYPTQGDYNEAFGDFIEQSERTVLWDQDAEKLGLSFNDKRLAVESYSDPGIEMLKLIGLFNRRDAFLVVKALGYLTNEPEEKLIKILNRFPGLSRRFEKIADNLYSDYAHTPEKILGCMSVAGEISAKTAQKIVIIYEPLTNRRMHYTANDHKDVFEGASAIYWVPSYLSREDPHQPVLKPAELIKNLSPELQEVAKPMELDEDLVQTIKGHLDGGDLVVAMSGGGGGSLDEWLRNEFVRV
ncbi:hypothetical protein H0X09_00530 [Candidatus Saccharibacteria bacterium]|nr:hypothetical protein [Candidatus Saccharibacteria bacterium]